MTPFGQRLRHLRREQGVTQRHLAGYLAVSPAYLSALEHGRRGRPSAMLVDQICAFFEIIWDEADDLRQLARLSHPRIVMDTAGLSPEATELANRLALKIGELPAGKVTQMLAILSDGDAE